jgi:hypothetical protein
MAIRSASAAPFVVRRARLVGLLYFLLVPLAIFGIEYVPSHVGVAGDAAATARNILASESLFRLGIVTTILSHLATDVLWPLVLYQLLKPASRTAAVLMVLLSLLGLPISLLNELNQVAVLLVLHGTVNPGGFTPEQANALAALFLNLHDKGTEIAEIFWGLWLFPYGYLVFKSGFLPRILGILLMIGCFGYLIPSLAGLVYPDLLTSLGLLPGLSSLGELLVPLWLAIKGLDAKRWMQADLAVTRGEPRSGDRQFAV